MTRFDDELRNALRRQEPPAGFADRVLRRAADPRADVRAIRANPASTAAMRPYMRWAAAAAIVAALAGGMQYRAVQKEHEERARAEAAKQQVLQALRIAGSKLQLVQVKIREVGS